MLTQNSLPRNLADAVDELLRRGVPPEDVKWAVEAQRHQRAHGRTPPPLTSLLNLEPPQHSTKNTFSHLVSNILGNVMLRGDDPAVTYGATAAALVATKPKPKTTGGLHITRRPVKAGSVQTGSPCEADFVRPISKDTARQLVAAVKRLYSQAVQIRARRRAGDADLTEQDLTLSRLTRSHTEVFRILVNEGQRRRGWCFPSYETLAEWADLRSRRTVNEAINVLREIGLLSWIRRFDYTPDPILGARSEQTSNLYRFQLPVWVAKLIGFFAPPPDDAIAREEAALEERAIMMASASPAERRRLMPEDPEQRAALLAAAMRVDRRSAKQARSQECKNCAPPLRISLFKKKEEKELPWPGNTYALTGSQ